MKYVFVLSKENLDLAKEEVTTLVNTIQHKLINNILIVEIGNIKSIKKLSKRLAYTKSIFTLLFESSYKDFLKNMENFDWNSIYKDDFCIRVSTINKIPIINNTIKNKTLKNNKIIINDEKIKKLYSEKELAGYVWRKVKKPKVNLENPKTPIEIFFTQNKVLCCLLLKRLKHDFEKRKSHLRPRPSPISLHPKLARAMVNLAGAEENEIILDPFCGSGGILIEAGLMGFKTVGYDISKKMIWKSMVNLKHYKIKNCKLAVKNFFEVNKKYEYTVSDLPYGLNTNIMKNIRVTKYNRKEIQNYLATFYNKTIKKLEKILTKRAVIIFPNYFNYKKIINNSKLKLKNEFESYVHSNLTRKIVVLEK